MKLKLILIVATLALATSIRAAEMPDAERLVDAIGKAENSKAHPYGIMQTYRHTTPRQACLNTVRSAEKRWIAAGKPGGFIEFLAKTYAPVGAKNDPTGLNRNWVKNVKFFYNADLSGAK
jgi:hypothetical protein